MAFCVGVALMVGAGAAVAAVDNTVATSTSGYTQSQNYNFQIIDQTGTLSAADINQMYEFGKPYLADYNTYNAQWAVQQSMAQYLDLNYYSKYDVAMQTGNGNYIPVYTIVAAKR